jgi:hypothetical protein
MKQFSCDVEFLNMCEGRPEPIHSQISLLAERVCVKWLCVILDDVGDESSKAYGKCVESFPPVLNTQGLKLCCCKIHYNLFLLFNVGTKHHRNCYDSISYSRFSIQMGN